MSVVVQIPADVEGALRAEAARSGVAPDTYVQVAVLQKLAQRSESAARTLSDRERELEQVSHSVLDGFDWERYHDLKRGLAAHTLTPAERNELIALADKTEEATVRRLEALAELANLRNTTVQALFDSLQLTRPEPIGWDDEM
ncbi:MAG: hypothetical protein ACRC1H_07405 [Caldilineaceae bacterium]